MNVKRLGFLGVRVDDPDRFAATVSLYRDVLDLPVIAEEPDRLVWFRLGDGTQLHVYGPLDQDHVEFGASPCVGFVVDDTEAMRARLETAGIAFLWETQRDGAIAWAHYRGPDGAVYELLEGRDA
jgi:catechol 2,3-dioxygenase-like lactoylglutathione lyase family enzyme